MGVPDHSHAALRFFGDDLIPEELTALLGATPTSASVKGQQVTGRTGMVRIAKTGKWILDAERRDPEDLESQVFELLDRLTPDLDVWAQLSRFKPDLFCGVFMACYNDGLSLSPRALLALGQRGIELDLDIYECNDKPSE